MRAGFIVTAIALTAAIAGGIHLIRNAGPVPVVELDERQGIAADPRMIAARIQSNMERVAAGRPTWPLPPGAAADPGDNLAKALGRFLADDAASMDAILGAPAPALAPAQPPLVRLIAAIKAAEAKLAGTDPHGPRPLLRLPCRAALGRMDAVTAAATTLATAIPDILACPSDGEIRTPQALAPRRWPVAAMPVAKPDPAVPPQPWTHEQAVAHMDADPDLAEPILAAAEHPAGKLDYALFLHALRPPSDERDSRIRALIDAVETESSAQLDEIQRDVFGPPVPYDGSDASLVVSLQAASSVGVATTHSAFYAIPCAVLVRRPGLSAAIDPVFGGNRDNFLPRSGCAWGRGFVAGFPDAEVQAFIDAARQADGDFIDSHGGTMRFAHMASQAAMVERMKIDGAGLAEMAAPVLDYPYQIWGLLSLSNRAIALRLKAMAEDLGGKLEAFYRRQGLPQDKAALAARVGLFRVVFGAECGDARPGRSLRAALMDGAPVDEIRALLNASEDSAVLACGTPEPPVLVAVARRDALPAVLKHFPDTNLRNEFGKTALMVAAQFDQVDNARLLLQRGARVNAVTWQQDEYVPLRHDGRSALMYAAANASLPMIRLLLDQGADPMQADTMGRRAVDYLLGFGPVPPNPRLSEAERAQAAALLY